MKVLTYDFRKRITLCRLMPIIFSTTIRTGESPFTKPNSLFAFQTYTVADSKKNRSQFLKFKGGLRSQFLRFGGGLRSQFLRFRGGLRSQFLRFREGLRSQFLRFGGGLRSQVLDLGSLFLRHPCLLLYIDNFLPLDLVDVYCIRNTGNTVNMDHELFAVS